jgi:hypothetical protein
MNLNGIMKGCMVALDGWLCQIHFKKGKSYFLTIINAMQATCDAYCRFTLLPVLCPG